MAAATTLQQAFAYVVSQAGAAAASQGYVRRGVTLRKVVDGNAAIINFQRSRWNSADGVSFTINLSVVCGLLLDPNRSSIKSAKEYEGHLRRRIGWFLPGQKDKWWEITSTTKIDVLSAEIADLVLQVAVPYLSRYLLTKDLVALWESGAAPGITEFQRQKYLAGIKNAKQ
jgi:hypothetical protein